MRFWSISLQRELHFRNSRHYIQHLREPKSSYRPEAWRERAPGAPERTQEKKEKEKKQQSLRDKMQRYRLAGASNQSRSQFFSMKGSLHRKTLLRGKEERRKKDVDRLASQGPQL